MFLEKNRIELDTQGYTVVTDVLTTEECDQYMQEYKQWLSQFKDHDWPYSKNSLIQRYNVGHLEVTWRVRVKSKSVFTKVWNTEKLLSSFDAIAIGRPPECGKESFQVPGKHWLHCDQHAERIGLHAYQGAVYLEQADKDDWTFFVVDKSHLFLDYFYQTHPNTAFRSNKTFYVSDEEMKWFDSRGCKMVRVPVPKGGMVLWDSRLLHANARPLEGRNNPGRWRYAVFVSMTPAIWATEHDIQLKQRAYNEAAMTGHWSSQGIVTFDAEIPDNFPRAAKIPTAVPLIAQTQEFKQLSGVTTYDFSDGAPNGPEWTPQWRTELVEKSKVTR